MNSRKIIIVLVGIAILGGGYLINQSLSDSKRAPKQKNDKVVKGAFIEEVQNEIISIQIEANGNLVAKNKVELYSEVQGVLQVTSKEFRPGVQFRKGQTILKINSDEFYANLQAQKSNLQNLVASIMPDIRLDYPDSFENWDNYLKAFDIHQPIAQLPEPLSEQEKYFITGNKIYTTYYNVKNMEARLVKYNITAPYNGILTEVNVNTGTLVRPGQKMGELIDPSVFEMELAVPANYANVLVKGKNVTLNNLDKSMTWTGKVSRINGRVDQQTQTVNIYIELRGENLREGMYLEANVATRDEADAYRIPRKLLIENKAVFIVEGTTLKLKEVEIIHFGKNTVVIRGIENGTKILSKSVPGAFHGMSVKILN